MSGLVVSFDSTEGGVSPLDSFSRLVSVATVSASTSRFLSERWVASLGASFTSFSSGTSTDRRSDGIGGGGGGGAAFSGGGGGGGGCSLRSGGGGSTSASSTGGSSSFSGSSVSGS